MSLLEIASRTGERDERNASETWSLRRALLVVNPAARRGARDVHAALRACARAHVDARVVETEGPGHATSIVQELATRDRFDAVVVVGGDGTAMEVISGLAGRESAPPVGVLAGGTANILARTLGMPMDAGRAIAALTAAAPTAIDLGRLADGRRFAIGLGVGLDAAMISGTSSRLKRRIGYLAYAVSALRAGMRMESFTVRVTVDGVPHDVETASLLIANFGSVVNGLFHFGHGVRHDDGVLDACIYSPRTRLDAVRIGWRMIRGTLSCERCFATLSGRHFVIEPLAPRVAQADGELIPPGAVEITVEPGAGRVLVPRRARLMRVLS